jgi:hypothetical protein
VAEFHQANCLSGTVNHRAVTVSVETLDTWSLPFACADCYQLLWKPLKHRPQWKSSEFSISFGTLSGGTGWHETRSTPKSLGTLGALEIGSGPECGTPLVSATCHQDANRATRTPPPHHHIGTNTPRSLGVPGNSWVPMLTDGAQRAFC